VVGRGFFLESVNMPLRAAWERFGIGNGSLRREDFYSRIPEALEIDEVTDDTLVSCLIVDGLEWLDAPVSLPARFFPQGVLGAKFYEDEDVAFIAAFPEDSAAGAALSPLVLFEAEATAGGDYDDWNDLTGEQYHYPNQYRNRVVEGRRFIYYRGVRRRGGARGLRNTLVTARSAPCGEILPRWPSCAPPTGHGFAQLKTTASFQLLFRQSGTEALSRGHNARPWLAGGRARD
jgi:hypothetical protein